MGTNGWNTNSAAGNRQIVDETANLANFPCDLHFFFGVTIFLEFVNLWDDIEGERVGEDFVADFLAVEVVSSTLSQFIHSWLSSTTGSLISCHDAALHAKLLDQGPECHKSNGCRTIRVGNQLGFLGFCTVDFWHDQGDFWSVAKGRLQGKDKVR
jgi:hypothetical protein